VFVEEGLVIAVTHWGAVDGYFVLAEKHIADQAEFKQFKADLSKAKGYMEKLKKRRTNIYTKDGTLIL